jgi:osmotically-inducible protein OsmY
MPGGCEPSANRKSQPVPRKTDPSATSRRHPRRTPSVIGAAVALCAAGLMVSGCAGTLIGAAATGGTVIAQERSVGDAIDDATIRIEINHYLYRADEHIYLATSIDVVEGRVLLTGDVDKPEHRIVALEAAWQAEGVREVINELQVNDVADLFDAAEDALISAQLSTELLFDLEISSINYNVETVNGVVYLIGLAQDQAELDRVIDRARTIAGVRQVVNHVRLKDDPRREGGP